MPKSYFPLKFKVKSPRHALELARQLIRPFRNWTVNSLAVGRLEDGKLDTIEIPTKSPQAQAFCALGALRRVNSRHEKKATLYLSRAAQIVSGDDPGKNPPYDEIFNVNDCGREKKTHHSVLKMFAQAIRLAEKDEKTKGVK